MRLLKTLRFILLFFPFAICSQTVQENLQYINNQFEQFNKYQTSFDVDEVSKKIICRDKFGMYSAYLKDIKIKKDESEASLEIFCIDESKCISSLKKDGRKGSDFSNYSMELSKDRILVSNVDTVLDKFSKIRKAVLENDIDTSNAQNSHLIAEVEHQLHKLNSIFLEHSHYQNIWSFDWENQHLIGRTETCEVRIAISNVTIEFYEKENQQKFRYGFVIKSTGSDITEKCPSFEDYVSKTYEYVDRFDFAEEAIHSIKTIQRLVSGKNEPPSTIAPTNTIDQQLSYINNQFKKYNAFNTRFFVDLKNMELIWIQDFGESRAPINDIDFKADYENGWIIIFCKNKSLKCISFANPGGTNFQYTEYSMSLKENDETIAHMDKIIKKFRKLQKEIIN